MNYVHEQPTHEEINLVRLLRRLEKSVASPEEWDSSNTTVDVLLKVHKTSQVIVIIQCGVLMCLICALESQVCPTNDKNN